MTTKDRDRLAQALKALSDATGDMPCTGTTGGGSGTSDRTGSIALRVIEGVDTAWADTQRLNTLLETMIRKMRTGQSVRRQIDELNDIINRWAPTDNQRRAITANLQAAANDLLNRHDDHGNCTSCKQVPGAYGTPHARGLCKTCDRWLQRILASYAVDIDMPPRRLVELGHAKGKITDHDINAVMHGQPRRDT